MDVDFMERNGNKRGVNQRNVGGGRHYNGPGSGKVCAFWLEGRCNRNPCNFLHQKPDQIHNREEVSQQKRALVWRNPNGSGGSSNQNGPSKWGKTNNGVGGASSGGRALIPTTSGSSGKRDKICNFFYKGNGCKFGDNCKFMHSWFVGDDLALLTPLEGHRKAITGIAFPLGSDKLYSGSNDGSVKVWDCQTGKCIGDFNLGSEVGCLVSEGAWLFVGVLNAVKAWNPLIGIDLTLDGPVGIVYSLVIGNDFLFAGVQRRLFGEGYL